jgi:hypothetical protein
LRQSTIKTQAARRLSGGREATERRSLTAACGPQPKGDVDAKDVGLLVDALLLGANAAEVCVADFTGDGRLDGADVQGFVGAVVGTR